MPSLRNSLNIRSRVMWVRAFFNTYKRRVIAAGGVIQNEPCAVRSLNNNLLRSASWTLVPSGIKEDVVFAQKPTSGLGDLTFTRASDATYTDASGVVRRSPYNLLQFSEQFDNGVWGKLSGSTVTANQATAPNGTLTADLITEGTSVLVYFALNLFRAGTYTQSYYAKKGTGDIFGMYFGSGITARFNLTSGTIVSTSDATATIQSVGNGWYRCTATATRTSDFYAGISYANAIGLTVFAWGAQLVEGTEALDYFPTTNRQDVPRIDFRNADGTLSSCGRLLLEPQRTNSIRNSSMVGAVAGSPGTVPTNWSVTSSGLTRTIVGIGTELGLPYIDIRLNGTASAVFAEIYFDAIISASAAQSWTNVVYSKIITTPTAPNSYILATVVRGSSTTIPTQAFTPTYNLSRFAQTITTPTGATSVQSLISFGLTVGATYDFTIRIAAPQMELGAYATTWVPTTTAAVTRLTDSASKTGVSSLIGQTEGTMFFEFDYKHAQTNFGLFEVSTTISNIITLFALSDFNLRMWVFNATVQQAAISTTTVPAPGRHKAALAYKSNDFVFYLDGVQIGTDTSGTIPATSEIYLRTQNQNTAQAALFPTRLTNAQLAQLTTL